MSKRRVIFLSIIVVLLTMVVGYVSNIIYPLVLNIAQSKVKVIAINAINEASTSIRAIETFYGDFYEYIKNDSGDIILISGNPFLINQINFIAQKEVQEALNTLNNKSVDIPLGAFTGSALLASIGPNVAVQLIPIGSTVCNFKSSFKSAGINQTIHRLYIEVKTQIDLVVPINNISVDIVTEIFIAENIIVGKVPDVYLDSKYDNYLDLIP